MDNVISASLSSQMWLVNKRLICILYGKIKSRPVEMARWNNWGIILCTCVCLSVCVCITRCSVDAEPTNTAADGYSKTLGCHPLLVGTNMHVYMKPFIVGLTGQTSQLVWSVNNSTPLLTPGYWLANTRENYLVGVWESTRNPIFSQAVA